MRARIIPISTRVTSLVIVFLAGVAHALHRGVGPDDLEHVWIFPIGRGKRSSRRDGSADAFGVGLVAFPIT